MEDVGRDRWIVFVSCRLYIVCTAALTGLADGRRRTWPMNRLRLLSTVSCRLSTFVSFWRLHSSTVLRVYNQTITGGQLKDVRCCDQLTACDGVLFWTESWVKPIITDADVSEPRYLMADVRPYSYESLPAAAYHSDTVTFNYTQ